jgi:hypothetical protein
MHNPYWDEVLTFPENEITWKYDHRWEPEQTSISWRDLDYISAVQKEQIRHRDDLCIEYAWSIPDPVSLEFVAGHLGKAAIEIGAGSGYWAYCLKQLGTHVVAYDAAPPQRIDTNHWHSPRKGHYQGLAHYLRPVWHEVYWGNHNKAARFDYPLFLCWPPYDDGMATKTLMAYRGSKLVYIGESSGGCTADDAFFALLDKHWELVDEHRPIQWSGIRDYISAYTRKSKQEA